MILLRCSKESRVNPSEPYFSGFTRDGTRDGDDISLPGGLRVALDIDGQKGWWLRRAPEQEAEAKLEGKPELKPVDFAFDERS